MTTDYLLAALRSIREDCPETCYEAASMEYDDSYPCPRCRLGALIADLEAEQKRAAA